MVIAIIAVVAVIAVIATGRGGELSVERSDYAPLDLGPVSATDIALLRPPTGVWGYSMQATDDALEQIAEAIRERDVRIVALEQLVTDLSRDHAPMAPLASPYTPPYASPYDGAGHRAGRRRDGPAPGNLRQRVDRVGPAALRPPQARRHRWPPARAVP